MMFELVRFDHDVTSEEVLEEFARRGLERPISLEDVLYFGIKHPEEQHKQPVIFLHEPVRDPDGRRVVCVLYGGTGWRHLDLDESFSSLFSGDAGWRRLGLRLSLFNTRWRREGVFVGVRK